MNIAVVDIGRFARVPYDIATAKISPRAREVWTLLSFNASPGNPEVWVRQASLAEQLGCSTDTICRAIRDLMTQGLIVDTKKWYQGRHKIYRLSWNPTHRKDAEPPAADLPNDVPQDCKTTYRADAVLPTAKLPVHVPQKCGNLIRIRTEYEKNNFFLSTPMVLPTQVAEDEKKKNEFSEIPQNPKREGEALLHMYGQQWKNRFGCLDGRSGRPSIEECVEQAMAHEARRKYDDVKVYVEGWLRNAGKQWIQSYFREQNAHPMDPFLNPEVAVQKRKGEEKRRQAYLNAPQGLDLPSPKVDLPAEVASKLTKIAEGTKPGFLIEMLKAAQKAHRHEQIA